MVDRRVYSRIEGFEVEVDLDIVLSDRYGVALILEGPMKGYEIVLGPSEYERHCKKWEEEHETDES